MLNPPLPQKKKPVSWYASISKWQKALYNGQASVLKVTNMKMFDCNASHVKLTSTELEILEELSIHCC